MPNGNSSISAEHLSYTSPASIWRRVQYRENSTVSFDTLFGSNLEGAREIALTDLHIDRHSQKNTGNRKQHQKAQYMTEIKRAYEELCASESDSIDQIKKKFKKLMGRYHPDRNPGKVKVMTKKTQRITAAYRLIMAH